MPASAESESLSGAEGDNSLLKPLCILLPSPFKAGAFCDLAAGESGLLIGGQAQIPFGNPITRIRAG